MFSLSFLPWAVLLLGIILSIPIVSVVENKRRKKALAAMQPEGGVVEEEAMVEMDESGGFGDDIPAADPASDDPFANANFDDDPFK